MNSHSAGFNQIQPDQAIAICTREQAEQLVLHDHQQVVVSGRNGLVLTAEWLPLETHVGPFILTVVFHHAEGAAAAPAHIQAIVDALKFQIRGQAR